MGCVQAKPSPTTPNRHGIEKLKADHGYVGGPQGKRAVGPALERDEENGSEVAAAAATKDAMVNGWPRWLVRNVPEGVLDGLVPKSAESYVMIGKGLTFFDLIVKVGQGTYSNVYKARDKDNGKLVALKKVKFDTSESESVKFMAREITILQKLDHPNVTKLEGLATSRMRYSLYLVFEFMQTDLARIISRREGRLTEPQVEQLHRIFKLWGSPSEDYWRKLKLSTNFRPPQTY